MNTDQILKMMYNMQLDYAGMGRPFKAEDEPIKQAIIMWYNTTEIDWEECKFLWESWLEYAKLPVNFAIQKARRRNAKANTEPHNYPEL